jgi:thiol-disulfide isomerase/thioredoxin
VKNRLISLYILILLSFPIYTVAQPPSSVQIYFFYAEDCQPCRTILQDYLPTLKTMVPNLEVKTFDVGNPAYYEALAKLEKKFGRSGSELPAVFVGDQMLSGEMEVMEKLNPLLLEVQAKGGSSPPPPLELSDSRTVTGDSRKMPITKHDSRIISSVEVTYFYQKGCPKCDRANALLKYLVKKYPQLIIKEIDLNTPDGKRLNETISNRLNLSMEKRLIAPTVFIGNDYLPPDEITESKVEALIQKYEEKSAGVSESKPTLTTPTPIPSPSLSPTPEESKKAEESIIQRFKSFGVLAILLAGLMEGMNPCALATLVFFISYLTMVGRKRKEIFWGGLAFSGTGFITHLSIGIGILSFIQHLSFLPLFSQIVYFITFLFALLLGIFSLYDYIQLKKGRPSKMKLQVPNFLKKKIHQMIRVRSDVLEAKTESTSFRFLLSAVVIGFIVTLFQSTCTSQVYLPTILFVTNIPSLRGSAVLYLILYNFIYILPLLVIFGIVYWGVTSEQLSFFLQKRASTIKLLTSVFFFALAGILILSLI